MSQAAWPTRITFSCKNIMKGYGLNKFSDDDKIVFEIEPISGNENNIVTYTSNSYIQTGTEIAYQIACEASMQRRYGFNHSFSYKEDGAQITISAPYDSQEFLKFARDNNAEMTY